MMTTEKAIQLLQRISDSQFDGIHGDERREALERAVRALSGDGDLISKKAVMKEFSDFVRKSNNSDFAPTPTWNDAVSLVGSMPSAQPVNYGSTKSDSSSQLKLNNDLISRQQAIDALDGFRCGTKAAWKVIEDLPSAQPHWVPCSERLPEVKLFRTEDADYEISEAVLVTRDSWQDTKIEIGFWEVDDTDRKYWVDEYEGVLCGVVAWMPLPKPYGGENDG